MYVDRLAARSGIRSLAEPSARRLTMGAKTGVKISPGACTGSSEQKVHHALESESPLEAAASRRVSSAPAIREAMGRDRVGLRWVPRLVAILTAVFLGAAPLFASCIAFAAGDAPTPLLARGRPVSWWFVFKLKATTFPDCNGTRTCPFGGQVQTYTAFSQSYVYVSSEDETMQEGGGCLGTTKADPVGATFNEVYNGSYYYVIWNDQFYQDPEIAGCGDSCSAPWGHSKGMLAWDDAGSGFVMQVTTPSWPASGSADFPRRTDGNTLGCIENNNVKYSQDFFALKLTKADVLKVLAALRNASVVTDIKDPQIVRNGGPKAIQNKVKELGVRSLSKDFSKVTLSSGVVLISKPSRLHVPPWQMVSSLLGRVSLRAATWWSRNRIYSTNATTHIGCWDDSLKKPGAVKIATTGTWGGKTFSLKGGANHAKIGTSISGEHHYVIFGDLNQEGALSPNYAYNGQTCASSQNGRGGLFYVMDDKQMAAALKGLIGGATAPTQAPK